MSRTTSAVAASQDGSWSINALLEAAAYKDLPFPMVAAKPAWQMVNACVDKRDSPTREVFVPLQLVDKKLATNLGPSRVHWWQA